jgi:hypothetical protein
VNKKVVIGAATLLCVVAIAKTVLVENAGKVAPVINLSAAKEQVEPASSSVGQHDNSPTVGVVDPVPHYSTELEGSKHETKTSKHTEGNSNMQKQLTMFGMTFNTETSRLTPVDLENDIAEIEKYIANNDVITRLNEEKVAKEDLGRYVRLMEHLTLLRRIALEHKIETFGREVDDAVTAHASMQKLYKQGALYDEKKYGKDAIEQEIRKLKDAHKSNRQKQEMEDRALLNADFDKRS